MFWVIRDLFSRAVNISSPMNGNGKIIGPYSNGSSSTGSNRSGPNQTRAKFWSVWWNWPVLTPIEQSVNEGFIKSEVDHPIGRNQSGPLYFFSKLNQFASIAGWCFLSKFIGWSNRFCPAFTTDQPHSPSLNRINVVQFNNRNRTECVTGQVVNILLDFVRRIRLVLHSICSLISNFTVLRPTPAKAVGLPIIPDLPSRSSVVWRVVGSSGGESCCWDSPPIYFYGA